MKRGATSIICIAFVAACWLLQSSVNFWEALEIGGAAVVAVGVVGEYIHEYRDWPKNEERRKRFGEWSLILLIVGLIIELLGMTRSMRLSNLEIASLRLQAEQLREKNDNAEKQIARIDPINLPIWCVKADVLLVVRGNFDPKTLTPSESESSWFEFEGAGGDGVNHRWLALTCDKLETYAVYVMPLRHPADPPDGRVFRMRFSWPNDRAASRYISQTYKIEREQIPVGKLDAGSIEGVIVSNAFPPGMEISDGTCEITFNNSIHRKFDLPASTKSGLTIICSPMERDAP